MKTPNILALDFDGVICDGLLEYFEVAWLAYCEIWSPSRQTPTDTLAAQFYRLRPVIETGWEMPVLVAALVAGVDEDKILQEWGSIAPQLVLSQGVTAKEVGSKLDKLRDEWIKEDLPGWLSLHRFYPGVLEKLKTVAASSTQLYIVTTKEGRFVQQLLQREGVEIPPRAIFGKEVQRPKYQILRELIEAENVLPAQVWFVEDRLKTLLLVQQHSDLDEVQLFLADWGYNTATERDAAASNSRVHLLSLSQFAGEFAQWVGK